MFACHTESLRPELSCAAISELPVAVTVELPLLPRGDVECKSNGLVPSLLAGCADPVARVDTEAEEAELMRLSREWSEVAGSGDFEATLVYWADDAIIMAPGQPPLRGKEAIREYVEGTASIPGFGVRWEPVEAHVAASGDLAYLIERNQFTYQDSTGTPVTKSNKVVTVWRKDSDGPWKNVVDMWNADPTAWR